MRKLIPVFASVLLLGSGCASAPGGRITAWDQLPRNAAQPNGFGLYSYLLFAHEPVTPTEQARYLAAVREILAATPAADQLLATGVRSSRINLALIPVTTGRDLDGLSLDDRAREILEQYDYARAAAILSMFNEPLTRGPYIISARSPIDADTVGVGQHLMQDLTYTTPSNVGRWINAFVTQARHRNYRRADSVGRLMLELRNGLSVVSEIAPAVVTGVESLVKWVAPKP
ncbi:MAG TPA: hypothetical protein VNI54_12880 [Thermoanaerobaculia bacterium]|nr:hypothetical protein [Thermoanaerobaculia bacterium]